MPYPSPRRVHAGQFCRRHVVNRHVVGVVRRCGRDALPSGLGLAATPSFGITSQMDDADRNRAVPARDDADYADCVTIAASLDAYLSTRTSDVSGAVRLLVKLCPTAGFWIPIHGALAVRSGLSSCRFEAELLLRRQGDGLSAVITARQWSVTLVGTEAWIDVEWPSEAMAISLEGKPVRTQIDFPFLAPTLIVCGSSMTGAYRRFHCRESVTETQ